MRAVGRLLVAASLLASASLAQESTETAAQLEREGRLADAAAAYRATLERDPADVTALLGLERVSAAQGDLAGVVSYLRRVVREAPRNELVREVEFRLATALYDADSVAGVVARWVAAIPDSPNPYRQWASWLVAHGDLAAAYEVVTAGRDRVGTTTLTQDAARILAQAGRWEDAAREWCLAVLEDPALAASAGAGLAGTPPETQDRVLAVVLQRPVPPPLSWLGADLLVRWERAEQGWVLLDESLPADRAHAALLLRRFAERARMVPPPEGARARGFALERLAEVSSGPDAQRARLEAAHAFADAGELQAAARVLDRFQASHGGGPLEAAEAAATLIAVLADGGQIEAAEAQFNEWEERLGGMERVTLRQRLAWARVLRGETGRALDLLGADSTVGSLAIRGWVALEDGDLAGARRLLRAAGPYAGGREEASQRAETLVLLERVAAERAPALGAGLLTLARGDTAAAVPLLRDAAAALPPAGGRADVLALAGALATALGDHVAAERLLLTALAADSLGPAAPAATYALADAYLRMGRAGMAVERLETLILSYPESAIVPQARRLLDRARGMVP